MKYLIICTAALILSFGIGSLFAFLALRKTKTPHKKTKTAFLSAGFALVILAVTVLAYMGVYYRAGDRARAALSGSAAVAVRKIDGGYYFDGPGESEALVFYPGAKVACEAYAPLMLKLSEAGTDCFLCDVPLHFAILSPNLADKFVNAYDYESWVTAGHSLGGIAAAAYAEAHPERIDGLVLLASYPTSPVEEGIRLCCVYGSKDGLLNREDYLKNRCCWPADAMETVIDGGNHAQFGDYGFQKGDGIALISDEAQQTQTAEAITRFLRGEA